MRYRQPGGHKGQQSKLEMVANPDKIIQAPLPLLWWVFKEASVGYQARQVFDLPRDKNGSDYRILKKQYLLRKSRFISRRTLKQLAIG